MKPPVRDRIYCGDAAEVLRTFASDTVDSIVTSPPYFQQRNYGESIQLGQEATPQAYVERVVMVMREARRALKSSGSLWLVLGDKYDDKRLLGIPWRVALALQDDGWILRSDIIWHKPNAMPSAVKNRPTIDHEYIFLLTKDSNYYYDIDAIREPHVTFTEKSRMRGGRRHFFQRDSTPEAGKNQGNPNLHNGRWDQAFHPAGRNKRTVWSIPLSNSEALTSPFPEPLVETCILAGCPAQGLVLDPFLGSGTTAVVARRLGRSYVGIDCNEDYCAMATQRLLATASKAE